jgi:hypothetical protein
MINRILKFSLIIGVAMLMYACGNKDKIPEAFDNIVEISAFTDIKGFMPFMMSFPNSEDNKKVCVQYGNRYSSEYDKIPLKYYREEKDSSDNSVIYFFTEKNGVDKEYQIRVDENGNIVRLRFKSVKLNRNILYLVEYVKYSDYESSFKNIMFGEEIENAESDMFRYISCREDAISEACGMEWDCWGFNENCDMDFDYQFLRLLNKFPNSISYDFPLLMNKNIFHNFYFITSSDGKLRFYIQDIGKRIRNYTVWCSYKDKKGNVLSDICSQIFNNTIPTSIQVFKPVRHIDIIYLVTTKATWLNDFDPADEYLYAFKITKDGLERINFDERDCLSIYFNENQKLEKISDYAYNGTYFEKR